MAQEFVRKIRNTKLKGNNKEALHTNTQNDILSDDKDVYVRNQKEYHCLTDNIKEITTNSDNVNITKTGDNTVNIDVSESGGNSGVTSVNGKTGDVQLDKSDVGLGNVVNQEQEKRLLGANPGIINPLYNHKYLSVENVTSIQNIRKFSNSTSTTINFTKLGYQESTITILTPSILNYTIDYVSTFFPRNNVNPYGVYLTKYFVNKSEFDRTITFKLNNQYSNNEDTFSINVYSNTIKKVEILAIITNEEDIKCYVIEAGGNYLNG